jgi:small subunit ribosomal protein S10e
VLVAKKDYNLPKHEDLDVPNLEVIKALQSLTSKGLVKTQFSWQYYYYTVTPEGVEYLRDWCACLCGRRLELFDIDLSRQATPSR